MFNYVNPLTKEPMTQPKEPEQKEDLIGKLTDEIISFMSSYPGINFTKAHKKGYLYQFYVFKLIVQAAREENAKTRLFPTSSKEVTIRKSPGQIYSKGEYLYAKLDFSNLQSPLTDKTLEVHLGIQVQGKSETLHECDVCILERKTANTCRNEKRSPKHTEIMAAVECKCYESNGFTIKLGREFIGLTTEFEKGSQKMLFVANCSSNNMSKLLSNQNKEWYFNVLPPSQAKNTNSAAKTAKKSQNKRDTQELISYFKTIFKYYKTS